MMASMLNTSTIVTPVIVTCMKAEMKAATLIISTIKLAAICTKLSHMTKDMAIIQAKSKMVE